MLRDEDALRLRDMLEHAREAIALLQGKSRARLRRDRTLQLALVRLVEIVGEAAAHVSAEVRDRHRRIPWPDIIGTRNRLIHGYSSVDLDLVWDTVREDLSRLVHAIEAILANAE